MAIEQAKEIVICVKDDHAANELVFESKLVKLTALGAIVIDMGTSGVKAARSHPAHLRECGIGYIDAAVSGA